MTATPLTHQETAAMGHLAYKVIPRVYDRDRTALDLLTGLTTAELHGLVLALADVAGDALTHRRLPSLAVDVDTSTSPIPEGNVVMLRRKVTPDLKIAILEQMLEYRSPQLIAQDLGLDTQDVLGVAHHHGYPDLDRIEAAFRHLRPAPEEPETVQTSTVDDVVKAEAIDPVSESEATRAAEEVDHAAAEAMSADQPAPTGDPAPAAPEEPSALASADGAWNPSLEELTTRVVERAAELRTYVVRYDTDIVEDDNHRMTERLTEAIDNIEAVFDVITDIEHRTQTARLKAEIEGRRQKLLAELQQCDDDLASLAGSAQPGQVAPEPSTPSTPANSPTPTRPTYPCLKCRRVFTHAPARASHAKHCTGIPGVK